MVKKRNRKSKKIELWKILIAILVVLVVVFFLLKDVGIFMGPETTNVTRVADHRIVGASEYVTINLGVVIGEGENSYAIEEIIPSGWNVFDGGGGNLLGDTLRWVVCGECVAGTTYGNPCYTNNGTEDILCCDEINSSGCWNYNGIDYEEGCCVMDIDADLSYIIQAPSTISGTNTYSLDGQFMFEDFTENATTFGQTEVYGSSDSIVTRQFSSSSIEVGDTIEVYLDVLIEGGETYYAIEEFVPAGFNVVDYGGGNTSDSHILKWANINISEDLNRGYSYNITALNSGDHSFYGNYSFENITGPITVYSTYGQDSVSVSGDSEICIDSDEDGYGVCPNCNLSNGCTFDGHDCDDDNSEINPGATEICGDGVDNDCSGEDLECPSCGEGQITSMCNCGGANYDSGYCCSDVWKGTACVSDILRSFNTSSANSYELINVSLNVIIYNDESHYVIEEFIPSCWNVVDAGIASLVENRLRWAVCGECGGGSVWGGICETYNGSEYIPCCDVINESGCWNNNGIGYEEGCCVWDIDADLSYIIQSAGITENAQFYGEYMYEGSSSNTTVGGQDTISINGLPAGCDSDGDCYYADNVTCNFGGDCDDSNPNVHPGATDICNGIDDDCNGFIDQGGDLLCDDGLHCNGIETCEGVLGCQSGTAPDCDDGVGCTDDSCNEATDSCDNIPNNANCDDGVVCNGTETCDSVLDCQAGIPVDCSGSDESEIDVCDYVPDGNPLTRDYRVTFTSQCQEPTGDCTEADDGDITHTCSISQCGAECEDSSDCDDSDLSTTDTCLNNCSCINTFNCTDLDGDGYNITAECNGNGMPDCDVNNASRWVDTLYFYDSDGDGYGVSDNNITLCTDGGDIVGYSMIGGDCNDGDSNIHPGATEICGDGIDNDCSGSDASCPSTSSSSSSSSSSSGSGDDEGPSADFSLSVDTLILELRQGQSDQEEFVVTNNGSESLDFSLSYNSNMFFIPIRSFSLDVGESETVKVNFGLSEDQSPGTYMSAIMVNAGEIERRIAVAISVTSVDSLFDVKIEVPEEKVPAGEEVDIDVYLTRLVEMEGDNVSLIYSIKDEEGNEVYTESESLFVENSLEFVKKFLIPDHLKGGKYLVLARVEYGDKVAESSSWINVGKKAPALFLGFFVFITIVLVLVLVVVLIIRSKQNNISLRDVVKNATNTNSGSNSAPGNVTQVK